MSFPRKRLLAYGLGALFTLSSAPAPMTASASSETETPERGPLRIKVHKAERTLLLYSGDTLLERYPVGLGPTPEGDKVREGDGRTPEGRYSVCVKNPKSRYYLSVGLTYPNAEDAQRALDDGRIEETTHRRILRALERGHCPPWDTALGGEIYIHGRGSSADWTLGCVALDDAAMKRLFEAVPVGTTVTILP